VCVLMCRVCVSCVCVTRVLVGVWWCVFRVVVVVVCGVRLSRCACVCLSCVFVWGVGVFVLGLFGE